MSRVITVGAGIKSGDYADAGDSATLKYVWNMKWVIVKYFDMHPTTNGYTKNSDSGKQKLAPDCLGSTPDCFSTRLFFKDTALRAFILHNLTYSTYSHQAYREATVANTTPGWMETHAERRPGQRGPRQWFWQSARPSWLPATVLWQGHPLGALLVRKSSELFAYKWRKKKIRLQYCTGLYILIGIVFLG